MLRTKANVTPTDILNFRPVQTVLSKYRNSVITYDN